MLRVRTDPPPPATRLPSPHPEGRLPEQEQSLIGVARRPERAHNREDDPRQQAYGRSFWQTTREGGTQLAQGRIRSLRELWTYPQDWRGSMVAERDRPDFGLADVGRNARRIMDHAESLFSRVMNPVVPQAEALATLGELHGWLSRAMPDVRASAAKAELCVRSLAQARGRDLPPFKPGFVPDLGHDPPACGLCGRLRRRVRQAAGHRILGAGMRVATTRTPAG